MYARWSAPEGRFRWAEPRAAVLLARPEDARTFEMTVNLGELQMQRLKRVRVEVLEDGTQIGAHEFTEQGWQTVRWPVPPRAAGTVRVEFRTAPALRVESDTRTFGIALGAFGYK
jgi:hypothetical protein